MGWLYMWVGRDGICFELSFAWGQEGAQGREKVECVADRRSESFRSAPAPAAQSHNLKAFIYKYAASANYAYSEPSVVVAAEYIAAL